LSTLSVGAPARRGSPFAKRREITAFRPGGAI